MSLLNPTRSSVNVFRGLTLGRFGPCRDQNSQSPWVIFWPSVSVDLFLFLEALFRLSARSHLDGFNLRVANILGLVASDCFQAGLVGGHTVFLFCL